jgi:hypothetical protein
MDRFSRRKRFRKVSYNDFCETALYLNFLAEAKFRKHSVKVRTAQDRETYNYTTVSFASDEVQKALAKRIEYTLPQFDEYAWKRSLSVELVVKDPATSMMIVLTCDKVADPKSLVFYYQDVGAELSNRIRDAFGRPGFLHSIGDGIPKVSDFNAEFGRELTGLDLRR